MSLAIFLKLIAIFAVVALGWIAGRARWLGEGDVARVLSNAAFFLFVPALLFRTTARIDLSAMPWVTLAAFFVPVLAAMLAVYLWMRTLRIDRRRRVAQCARHLGRLRQHGAVRHSAGERAVRRGGVVDSPGHRQPACAGAADAGHRARRARPGACPRAQPGHRTSARRDAARHRAQHRHPPGGVAGARRSRLQPLRRDAAGAGRRDAAAAGRWPWCRCAWW